MTNACRLIVGLATLVGLGVSLAMAGADTRAVKEDAKSFGKTLVPAVKTGVETEPSAERLPGYVPGPYQESTYSEDPDGMGPAGDARAVGHDGAQTIKSSRHLRAKFSADEIEKTLKPGVGVTKDPSQYVTGYSGGVGSCKPLPPSGEIGVTYEQTCNTGVRVEEGARTCNITLTHDIRTVYIYRCSIDPRWNQTDSCDLYTGPSGCSHVRSYPGRCMVMGRNGCLEPGAPIDEYQCSTPVPGGRLISTQQRYFGSSRNETACNSYAGGDCTASSEICIDSEPQTRVIEGISITQSCWAWRRTYTCAVYTPDSDCGQLEQMGCQFDRQICLSEDNPCSMWEKVYKCPLPDAPRQPRQYICDGDIVCMDGSCETISREPNTEFKDAVVALNTMRQVGAEFDPTSVSIFRGSRLTCAKTIFGITNCCVPRGFPLLGGCDAEDKLLKEKREKGLCHYVGTYCSAKTLGVCTKKRETHCCFESKLSRIIHVQGRNQLGLAWDDPKREACKGLTIDQFSQLDLSQMDFSEVYAEFTEAARLPNDLETLESVKTSIQTYYEVNRS